MRTKKINLSVLVVAVVTIVLIGIGYYYIVFLAASSQVSKSYIPSFQKETQLVQSTNNTQIILPVDPNAAGITNAQVSFFLSGVVTNIMPEKNGVGLQLSDTKGKPIEIEHIVVDKATAVTVITSQKANPIPQKVSPAQIKKGDTVFINYFGNLQQNPLTLSIISVAIIPK